MRCPLCEPLAALEVPLITHLLREHPEAQAVSAVALPLGAMLLARRPQQLAWFYLIAMALGLLLWASGPRPRRG